MSNLYLRSIFSLVTLVSVAAILFTPATVVAQPKVLKNSDVFLNSTQAALLSINEQLLQLQRRLAEMTVAPVSQKYHDVPFYSQFKDISSPSWQKVGCGIASTAMLIDFYSDEPVNVESLLEEGIKRNAYLDNAGWIHDGLIGLARTYGLDGGSYSLYQYSMDDAFLKLQQAVSEGPVMVSVHYTFQPTNPIPHLAVVTGVDNGRVYYNDPAEANAQNNISIEQFKSAWKKRYIKIGPTI